VLAGSTFAAVVLLDHAANSGQVRAGQFRITEVSPGFSGSPSWFEVTNLLPGTDVILDSCQFGVHHAEGPSNEFRVLEPARLEPGTSVVIYSGSEGSLGSDAPNRFKDVSWMYAAAVPMPYASDFIPFDRYERQDGTPSSNDSRLPAFQLKPRGIADDIGLEMRCYSTVVGIDV